MYQVIWIIFAEIMGWKCLEIAQILHQVGGLKILLPGNPGKLSNYVSLWINYSSKSYALETVERGLKNSSFHTLLTLVIKALYALSFQICTSLCLWRVREIKKIQKFGHLVWKCGVNTLTFFGEVASNYVLRDI